MPVVFHEKLVYKKLVLNKLLKVKSMDIISDIIANISLNLHS